MPASGIALTLVASGLPLAVLRLWWIWWQSMCAACGLAHSACACGPGDHMMRPRR